MRTQRGIEKSHNSARVTDCRDIGMMPIRSASLASALVSRQSAISIGTARLLAVPKLKLSYSRDIRAGISWRGNSTLAIFSTTLGFFTTGVLPCFALR